MQLEDCYNLPEGGDCSKLGIVIDVDENEKCYWEDGSGYRGTVAVSKTGKTCLKWARLMKEISDFPELAGQNYCRYTLLSLKEKKRKFRYTESICNF